MDQSVHYGILGPLELRVNGRQLAVGGPRVQAVLAVLVMQEGREIAAETLIDIVWGDNPPPTVRTSLQVHISKIRSVLKGAGFPDALATNGSAYSLVVDRDQVDASAFRDLVEEGRELLAQGSTERALEAFRQASAMWRGAPLAGLDLPGLAPGSLRELEDLRDLTLVLSCEAELALGQHAEALPNLLRLRAELPLDERICELSALALYRSGRQADALA